MNDPLPQFSDDHKYWSVLLDIAEKKSVECAYILHGIRCGGGKLEVQEGKMVLQPRIGNKFEWGDKQEWEQDREKWLLPKKERFIEIFEEASNARS